MIATAEAASLLLKARTEGRRISELPESCRPYDLENAYQCQSALRDLMLKHYGGQIAGYKIACTNESIQRQMNINAPFYGPLLSNFILASPTKLSSDDFIMRVIEAEFAFQMASDLPSRRQEYTKEEVSKAVAAVMPSIEIVDSRYDDWLRVGVCSLIADNACNAAWIYGEKKQNWTDYDLVNQEVNLFVNGKVVRQGRGSAALGNPLNPLVWLANMLSRSGNGLKANDMVTTGITTEIYLGEHGDHIVADFGPIGSVELKFA